MQCLVQAVSVEEKKRHAVPVKSAESVAALFQLPHFDDDVIRKLHKRKVRTLPELIAVDRAERRTILQSSGLSAMEVEDVETALSAWPSLYVTARLEVEEAIDPGAGEDTILAETDIVTCAAHAILLRSSHQARGFDPESFNKGNAVRAYAPNYPFPRVEHWIFMVADTTNNSVMAWARVELTEAESAGARSTSSGQWVNGVVAGGGEEESENAFVERVGQRVELKFIAPPAGKHDLSLYIMPDSWIGADRAVPLKLRTVEPTRAQREGRMSVGGSGKSKKSSSSKAGRVSSSTRAEESAHNVVGAGGALDRSEESDLMLGEADQEDLEGSETEQSSYDGREVGSDEEDEDGELEWDSDEYGTEESGSEDGTESDEED